MAEVDTEEGDAVRGTEVSQGGGFAWGVAKPVVGTGRPPWQACHVPGRSPLTLLSAGEVGVSYRLHLKYNFYSTKFLRVKCTVP